MGIMSVNPEHAAEKIQDLRTLFINFHHLLNEYRPHQARESLIMMMEDQLERSKNEIEGIERMKMKVDGILKGLGQPTWADGIEEGEQPPALKGSSEDDVAGEDVWEELYKEFP
jgi:mediator of RNA polymerase II transcription subunit 7